VLLRLHVAAGATLQLAEAEVAVGQERAHAELGGQGDRGPVVGVGRRPVAIALLGRHLAQEAEGRRLVAALAALADELQGAVGSGAGVVELAGEEVRLAELQDAERMEIPAYQE
jgi:hypothetical protein